MTTLTIAQALATNATGIIVADTPVNIAQALTNASLVSRVSLFMLNGNGASGASDAAKLATLGSRFGTGGYTYTVRDSIQYLADPANAAGLAIATQIAVYDTAANMLANASSALVRNASSVLMSTSASLSLANLIVLEGLPKFSVLPGQMITLADTAAQLLAITAGQLRPSIKAFKVVADSVVSEAAALRLLALPQFSVASGIHLTVS